MYPIGDVAHHEKGQTASLRITLVHFVCALPLRPSTVDACVTPSNLKWKPSVPQTQHVVKFTTLTEAISKDSKGFEVRTYQDHGEEEGSAC